MPLIDLKSTLSNLTFQPNRVSGRGVISANNLSSRNLKTPTTLKTLPFQGDMKGYGDSGQPFIKFPIEGQTNNSTIKALYNAARTSVDFPIRGGGIKYNFQSQTFTAFSEIDKERIKKFLESKPRGAAFLQKQIGLQLTNPNIQTGAAIFNVQYPAPIPGVLQNTKIYNNGKNTLAQVGFSGTGIHAVRQGVLPIDLKTRYYSTVVGEERMMNASTVRGRNRLLLLTDTKMTAGTGFSGISNINNINEINSLGISTNKGIIYNYLTGPGSTYGVGSTIVKRYEDTRQAGIDWENTNRDKTLLYGAQTYDKILAKDRNISNKITTHEETREQIYKLTYSQGATTIPDAINMVEWTHLSAGNNPWGKDDIKDMIKFGFEFLDNDNRGDAQFVQFRALLNGGFTDNHSATWQAFKYMGRGEDFYTYQGFTRAINFAFMLAANSEAELKKIYRKLNHLASQVYPDYSIRTGMMRGPLVRLTVGDYIYRLAGFLESVNISVDQNAAWEILEDVGQLPHVVMVNISFKPVFNDLPRRATKFDPTANVLGANIADKIPQPPPPNPASQDNSANAATNNSGTFKGIFNNDKTTSSTKKTEAKTKATAKKDTLAEQAEKAKTAASSSQVKSRNAPKTKTEATKEAPASTPKSTTTTTKRG